MTAIQIPDELDRSLQQAAKLLGCPKDDLIREALETIAYRSDSELTEGEIAHLNEGVAQLKRGEKIPSEAVDQWFNELFERLEARAE